MKFLLDTNILVFLLRDKYNIDENIEKVGINNCYISEITLAELVYGAFCSGDHVNKLKQVYELSHIFSVIPISGSIRKYAEIKYMLRLKGLPIDDFDILIAATAITNKLTLVSDNTRHFQNIPVKHLNWIER